MKKAPTSILLFAALLPACFGTMPRLTESSPEEEVDTESGSGPASPWGEEMDVDPDDEEAIHEDPDALDGLLARLSAESTDVPPVAEMSSNEPPRPIETRPLDPSPDPGGPDDPGVVVPPAHENWPQTDEQCFAALEAAGVEYTRPDFDTPFVRTPILLDGPVAGVEIRPRWRRPNPENSVMDCRLALALVEVARVAKAWDVTQILFYSTYRPIHPPETPCAKGKAGRKCRAKQNAYLKAKKGKASRHRSALAIDIRWFVTASGETIDLLEDYERKSGSPPCKDEPETDRGRMLKDFACTLHERRIFNVILTPNANKDHHNHFHMDITPNAAWYIIR